MPTKKTQIFLKTDKRLHRYTNVNILIRMIQRIQHNNIRKYITEKRTILVCIHK